MGYDFCRVGIAQALVLFAVAQASWKDGEHFTGEWNGDRTRLAEHGLTIDLAYSAELFASSSQIATTLLGHIDAALTLDTEKLGGWRGGKLYFLGQNNHGTGINQLVRSATAISNYEATPGTQLTEFFYEHTFLDDAVKIRVGKQDANREFGTPRYGGNFINNNFGMFPSTPLPSYPTTGLGLAVIVSPVDWIVAKLCLFEGNPAERSFGFDTAFTEHNSATVIAGGAVTHRFGKDHRHGGTTSVAVWGQFGEIPEELDVPEPRIFESNFGVMVQNDERIYADPSNPEDTGGLNVITRFGWAQADRNEIPLYAGASVAWHGIGHRRDNDTVGLGFGYFQVNHQTHGTPGSGSELFFEAFYKARLTHFFSLQPDVMFYDHPGGDGRPTLLAALRLKVKL